MVEILGTRVDDVDMEESLAKVASFVASGRERMDQVVTINPEGLWQAYQDKAFAAIINQASLVTPDGTGVLWGARKMGRLMKGRVTGIDLLHQICRRAAKCGWRIYLLGAKPGVAKQAGKKLQERYPGLILAGCDNGYFRDREESVLAAIRDAQADVLFAALGMPYQEKWLYAHGKTLGCAVGMGVGGSFDVIAGLVKRAPKIFRNLRLEWLWRLLSDPKRWRRYLVIPKYMRAVSLDARIKKGEHFLF